MKLKLRMVLPILACTAFAAVHAADKIDDLLQQLSPQEEEALVRSFQSYAQMRDTRDLTSTSTYDLVAIPSNNYIYMAMTAKERRQNADYQLAVGKVDASTGLVDITALSPALATVDGTALAGTSEALSNPLWRFPADRLATFGTYPVVAYMDKSLGHVKKPYAAIALVTGSAGETVLTTTYNNDYATPDALHVNYLRDALESGVTSTIQALTSSNTYIFAAVPDSNRKWSDNDATGRGIALIKQDTAKLTPLPFDSLSSTDANAAKAALVEVKSYNPANQQISSRPKIIHAFGPATTATPAGIAKASIGEGAALHWDSTLNRLYIGLSHVHRDDISKSGGVLAMSMGYLDSTTSFTIQPIIYLQRWNGNTANDTAFNLKNLFRRNTNKQIIGNYYDYTDSTTNDAQISIKHIKTMHTSQGYPYLIVNSIMQNNPKMIGGILVEDVIDSVFALPIYEDTVTASANGTIAATYRNSGRAILNSSDLFVTPTDNTTLVDFTITPSAPFLVGGAYPPDGGFINELFVEGDTVFACVNGYKPSEAGIFASTALFTPKGVIRGWSPWQRVFGGLERVWGGRLDTTTGNFYAMTAQGNLPIPAELNTAALMQKELKPYYINSGTAKASQWGESEIVTANDNKLIDSDGTDLLTTVSFHSPKNQLTGIIGQTGTDFRGMISLDEFTPGFKQGQFSMDVIWSDSTVDLVRTGTYSDGIFTPTVARGLYKRGIGATGSTGTIFELTNPNHTVNPQVGHITCAEVSRIGLDTNTTSSAGFLFVGGTQALTIWQNAGNGWRTTASSNDVYTGLGDFLDISMLDKDNTFSWQRIVLTRNSTDLEITYTTSTVRICADGAKTNRFTSASDGNIYIMTRTELFKVQKSQLTKTRVGNRPYAYLKCATDYPINARANTYFTNMLMLSNSLGVVATTKGLYKFDATATFGPAALTEIDATNVPDTESSGAYTINTAYYHMIFVPASKGGAADSTSANGTLYVVQCDVYNMSGKVYRFDVNGTNITLINNVDSVPQFADFAKFRSAFVTDGSVAIMTQPNFVGNTDLMSISPISGAKNGSSGLVNSEQGLTTRLNDHPTASSNINDDITLADSRISEVARNSASGAWIIPSTQGVRVNQ